MPEGSQHSPENSPKLTPKEKKKVEKRVKKKAVMGFYYYASEYQRKKQKERKMVGKIVSGVFEPLTIHIRATRLLIAAHRRGGGTSSVLSNEFAQRALHLLGGK